MVRASRLLLKDGGNIGKFLSDFLVCPLSKQPLRHCEDSRSLICETIGVSFPIIDGIPCLVPKDGKLLEEQDKSQIEHGADPSSGNSERFGLENFEYLKEYITYRSKSLSGLSLLTEILENLDRLQVSLFTISTEIKQILVHPGPGQSPR